MWPRWAVHLSVLLTIAYCQTVPRGVPFTGWCTRLFPVWGDRGKAGRDVCTHLFIHCFPLSRSGKERDRWARALTSQEPVVAPFRPRSAGAEVLPLTSGPRGWGRSLPKSPFWQLRDLNLHFLLTNGVEDFFMCSLATHHRGSVQVYYPIF